MQDSVLGPWRDVAIIVLVIEMAVMVVVPGVVFYFAIRGVRAVKRRIYAPLLTARLWALRVQNGVLRASHAAIALPIAVEAAEARVRTTARAVADWIGVG